MINYLWLIALAFITVPIIVNNLGNVQYGFYIFIGTLLSLFSLIDLGVSTAINKFLTEKVGQQNEEEIKKYLGVAKTIFLSLAIFGSFSLLLSSFSTFILFEGQYRFMSSTLLIASLIFFVSTHQSLLSIFLQAQQRYDLLSKLGILFMTLQQSLLVIVVIYTKDIRLMFLVQLIMMIFSFFVTSKLTKKVFPAIKTKRIFDWLLIKKIYKFGFGTFFVSFNNSILTYFDKFLIPIFLGPQSLTYYSLPGTISSKIPGASTKLGSVIFSMSSNFSGSQDFRRQKILYEKSMRIISIFSLTLVLSVIFYAREILGYWINFEIADKSFLILILLSVTSFFLSKFVVINNILIGMGKIKELAIATTIMLMVNLLGLIVLLPKIGVIGAAIAYLIAVIPVLGLEIFVEKKYFNLKFFKKERVFFSLKIFLISCFVFFISFILKSYVINLITLLIFFSISNLLFLFLCFILKCIEKDEISVLKKILLIKKNKICFMKDNEK